MNLIAFRSQATVFRSLPRRETGIPRNLAGSSEHIAARRYFRPTNHHESDWWKQLPGKENPVSISAIDAT
jgi:hypothetical protein